MWFDDGAATKANEGTVDMARSSDTQDQPVQEPPGPTALVVSADEVAATEFTVVRKGYDPAEVREFLGTVAATLGQQDDAPDEFDRLGSAVAGVLRQAELTATKLEDDAAATKRSAKEEAGQLRSAAQADAREIRSQAESDAQIAIDTAKKTAVEEAKKTTARALSTAEAAAAKIRNDAQRLADEQKADSKKAAADIETAGRKQEEEHARQRREIEQSREGHEQERRDSDEDLRRAVLTLETERQALLTTAHQVVEMLELPASTAAGDASDVIDLRPETNASSDKDSGRLEAEPVAESHQQA